MNWLRLYSEARNDAKLRSLTAEQFRVWFNLLCLASEQAERGIIGYTDLELLALEVSGADGELLLATVDRLVKLRIVSHRALQSVTGVTGVTGQISFLHWEERQYGKPSDTPARVRERVAAHRAKSRVESPDPAPSLEVKRDVTRSNATEQSRAEQIQKISSSASALSLACLAAFPEAASRELRPGEAAAIATWLLGKLGGRPPPRDLEAFKWSIRRAAVESTRDNCIPLAATLAADAPPATPPPRPLKEIYGPAQTADEIFANGPVKPYGNTLERLTTTSRPAGPAPPV